MSTCSLSAAADDAARKLNVIVIVCDDLNCRLGCFGDGVVKSPNIDRLAARGVRFERAYCQLPICNPSRSSFMSGLTPEGTGVLGQGLNYKPQAGDPPFLHRLFQGNGYRTIGISKIFHGSELHIDPKRPGTKATDDAGGWDVLRLNDWPAAETDEARDHSLGEIRESHPMDVPDEAIRDGQAAREAVSLLKQHSAQGKPVFMGLGFRKPHLPWDVPRKYFDQYDVSKMPLAPRPPAGYLSSLPSFVFNESVNNLPASDQDARQCVLGYYAAVSFVDAQVGLVLDYLDQQKMWDNTVVVLFGDNGFQLGENTCWGKRTLFEESCRVPLIVAGAGVAGRGKLCTRPVELLDVYPTVAELAGLPRHAKLMGRSLAPLLADPDAAWDRPAYTVLRLPKAQVIGRSIRTQRYRYTEWRGAAQAKELYDHQTDPNELANLAEKPEMASAMAELAEQLHAREVPVRELASAKQKNGLITRATLLFQRRRWVRYTTIGGCMVLLAGAAALVVWRKRRRQARMNRL
ncbi:MAG: sulfatase [Tepidisphaerales bacterium]